MEHLYMTLVLWMELIKSIFAGHFKDTHTHMPRTCQTSKVADCKTSRLFNWRNDCCCYYILLSIDIKVFDIFDRHTHLQSTYGCYFAAMLDYREENVFRLLSFGSSLRIAGWSTTLPYANCSGPYSPLGKRQRGRIHDLQTYYVGGPMTKNSALLQPRSKRPQGEV